MHSVSTSLKGLLAKQRISLNHFFEYFDLVQLEEVLALCEKCQGRLLFSGVGKSSMAAQKIATTLSSIGVRAGFVSPTELLHGELGAIVPEDIFFAVSKSGKTKELLEVLPFIEKKETTCIALVSEENSALSRKADLSVLLPIDGELCPYDLLPTNSAIAQLLFGDLLAVALMERRGFSLDDYAKNHPAGAIGHKITTTVASLMKKGEELPICKPNELLIDILFELTHKQCGCVLISNEDNELLGIFTDGDLRRALQADGESVLKQAIHTLMTSNSITVSPDDLLQDAAEAMQKKRYVMMAPVLSGGKIVGLIRMHDIIHEGL